MAQRRKMTGTSFATSMIVVLLAVMIIGYVVFQAVAKIRPYELTVAYYADSKDETTLVGYVIRDERVLNSETGGEPDIIREEGERISSGGTVAVVYNDSSIADVETRLHTAQVRQRQLEYAMEVVSGAGAGVKLDHGIHNAILSMKKDMQKGRYSDLEQDISELKALVIRRDYSATADSAEALSTELNAVKREISELTAQRNRNARSVTVPVGGIFSGVVDGYESVLTPERLRNMTPGEFAAVTADSNAASNIGKVIVGRTWYFAANMDEHTSEPYEIGETVRLRFLPDTKRELDVKVHHMSGLQNGQCLVIFSCDDYLSEFTMMRRQTASIVHRSYSGIRVPSAAVRVEEGVSGVYCLLGAQAIFKPVNVVWLGNGYYLLEPALKKDGTENEGRTRLRAGDEVIITAEELFDGKVIDAS